MLNYLFDLPILNYCELKEPELNRIVWNLKLLLQFLFKLDLNLSITEDGLQLGIGT